MAEILLAAGNTRGPGGSSLGKLTIDARPTPDRYRRTSRMTIETPEPEDALIGS
jgi:hypothetical protein